MGAVKVSEVPAGTIVKVAGINWIVLDHIEGKGTLCLMEDILGEKKFHDKEVRGRNNWANSSLRQFLNSKFITKFQDTSLVKMEVDLTADDGMTDYGKTEDYVALLSADQYRKYRALLPAAYGCRWWLVTPYTCESIYSSSVHVVKPSGMLHTRNCSICGGVRPALIFQESVIMDDDPEGRDKSDAELWKEFDAVTTAGLAKLSKMMNIIEEQKI